MLAAVFATLATFLARAVARDLAWVEASLAEVGASLPAALDGLAGDPATVALVGLGLLSFVLAAGTFLVSRETGAAFAILAAATVGWFLFPYAEVPWATVITGAEVRTVQAPASAWWFGGAIMALATVEVLVSARERLLTVLERQGLLAAAAPVVSRSRRALVRLTLGSLLVGGLLAVGYALVRDRWQFGLLTEPDLLWVPIVLGTVLGVALWYAARRR